MPPVLPKELEGLSEDAILGLAALSKKLGSKGSKTRKAFTKLVQEHDPNYKPALSEDEVLEQVNERFAEEDEKRESARVKQQLEDERKDLLTRYTEDQVKAIEGLMQNRGIASYRDAAYVYAAEAPPPEPKGETLNARLWTLPQANALKDPLGARRQKLHEAIHDIRTRKSA